MSGVCRVIAVCHGVNTVQGAMWLPSTTPYTARTKLRYVVAVKPILGPNEQFGPLTLHSASEQVSKLAS